MIDIKALERKINEIYSFLNYGKFSDDLKNYVFCMTQRKLQNILDDVALFHNYKEETK